jgi:hypothetical protein
MAQINTILSKKELFNLHAKYLKQRYREYYLGLNTFYQMKLGGREAF